MTTTTNTMDIDLNRLTLKELRKAFKQDMPEAKLVAKVQAEMKGVNYAQRPLMAMKAALFLQAIAGEELVAQEAAEADENEKAAEKARKAVLIFEKAGEVFLAYHDKAAGVSGWDPFGGKAARARARTVRDLEARGLIDYQGEVLGETLRPVVQGLGRVAESVENLNRRLDRQEKRARPRARKAA
jgi:hypothetical protein